MSAIHGMRGKTSTASRPIPREKPSANRLCAARRGHSSTHAMERVSSWKVKSPRSKSLTSHFMKSLIQ